MGVRDDRNTRTSKGSLDGMESTGPAPTPYLNRIAEMLREPPPKPVKTFSTFKKLLGIKLHRNQYGHARYAVNSWLKNNLTGRPTEKIEHTMDMILETGDVLLLTQPYHHPNKADVENVQALGGYVVRPDYGWGFLHACLPDVYLVPANAVKNFDTR
ncbi:MAG TPA: hypothetical protein VMS31_08785 [Pyrinomonadaceae bacterium]|nr:hypothetical protein [Pyrinomonadaceae bacterium]